MCIYVYIYIYPGLQFFPRHHNGPRNEVAVKLYEKKGFRRTSTGGRMVLYILENLKI